MKGSYGGFLICVFFAMCSITKTPGVYNDISTEIILLPWTVNKVLLGLKNNMSIIPVHGVDKGGLLSTSSNDLFTVST